MSTYDSPATETTPMFNDARSTSFASSKSTIPSVIDTQQALIENIFDEISRLEDKLTPFLGNVPFPEGNSVKNPDDPSLSPTLDSLVRCNARLQNVANMIQSIATRIDS